MANAINSNTIYVDSTGSVSIGTNRNVKVVYIVLTATAANAVLELADDSGAVKKIYLGVATSGDSKIFDFDEKPLVFPNGINVVTATNVKATIVLDRSA